MLCASEADIPATMLPPGETLGLADDGAYDYGSPDYPGPDSDNSPPDDGGTMPQYDQDPREAEFYDPRQADEIERFAGLLGRVIGGNGGQGIVTSVGARMNRQYTGIGAGWKPDYPGTALAAAAPRPGS
jgi:hypothetical protein